jgi:hypothetical protein
MISGANKKSLFSLWAVYTQGRATDIHSALFTTRGEGGEAQNNHESNQSHST